MTRVSTLLVMPGVCFFALAAYAQSRTAPPQITFPSAEVHRLESKHVGASFAVRVLMPPTLPGENVRFPVVYATDATGEMVISDTMMRLMMLADTPRFITVGIGYPGASGYFQTMDLRQRDLTQVADLGLVPRSNFEGILTPSILSGGAPKFLDFIREELIPFIDARYPTDRSDRTYAGHSLGGLFGCYTLFTHPETFNRYVIGSPSLYWRDAELFTRAEQYTKTHRDLVANVFIGVGALEDGPGNPTMRNVRRLESLLLAQKYPSLKLSVRVFQDETHLTVWPQNLIRGLVSLFGRPAPADTLLAKYRALVEATQNGR